MGRPTSEEAKKRRIREQTNIRAKRFREKHIGETKRFYVDLENERFDLINGKLKEQGITKKQFLEEAIDRFLKETK